MTDSTPPEEDALLERQIVVRMPAWLDDEVTRRSDEVDRSKSWYIRNTLQVAVEGLKAREAPVQPYEGGYSTYGTVLHLTMPTPKGHPNDELEAVDRVLSTGWQSMYDAGAERVRIDSIWHETPLGTWRGAVAEAARRRVDRGDASVLTMTVDPETTASWETGGVGGQWPRVVAFHSADERLDFPDIGHLEQGIEDSEGRRIHYIGVTTLDGDYGYLTFWADGGTRWFAGGRSYDMPQQDSWEPPTWQPDESAVNAGLYSPDGDQTVYGPFVRGFLRP